jgi:aldehyde:ferredoxin oxidoreductase
LFGYHGRYLRIDVGTGAADIVPIDEDVLRRFIGGVGLGAWLIATENPTGADPLGAEAALVVALSPLVGSPLTTSAKFAVVALSPLTGRLCDALSSSHFAIAAKRTGVDAIVLRGASKTPRVVFIDGTGRDTPAVTTRPADHLWGLSAREAEGRLRAEHGADWQVASIGPAGERRVPYATISHDGRHAGRGGLGAVLGAKGIKAVAVRGDKRVAVADPARTIALARELSARSFGPATEKYRELGTVANLLVFNRFDALPSHNFQAGHFAGAERLAADDLGPARRVARNSCAACTIGCEHVYALKGKSGGVRLEYESLFALGPLCGVDDPDLVLRAASLCDELGVDTISTGGTAAFLMECAERGLIDARLPTGRSLRFGDGEALLDAIGSLNGADSPLADLLMLGSRRAAERIGGEAPGLAPHVKGMELPGYDPRRLRALALGLAVGTRGADHNRSGAYEADFSDRLGSDPQPADIALAAIETEDRAALIDSLILCKFLRGVFSDLFAESAAMLSAVTGWDVSADELRATSRRVVSARKCVNLREGWTRAEDTLPSRLLDGTRPGDLTRSSLDASIDAYYLARGWSADGNVPDDLRAALGLRVSEFGPGVLRSPTR